MTFARKLAIIGLLCLLASFCPSAKSQSTNQGNEIVLSGGSQTILTSVPASNLNQGTGTNTFIFTAGPNVSVSVYITNDTATLCSGSLEVTVNTTGEPQINSLNQNLAQWQIVPIINQSTGAFSTNSGLLSLVGNSTTVLKTAAIAGVKTAIQFNNTNAGCSSVTFDLAVVFTPVSITSPLISVSSNSGIVNGANNVQGVTASGNSASGINPVITAGVGPPVNNGFTASGFDNQQTSSAVVPASFSGNVIEGSVPTLQNPGTELAVAFDTHGGNSDTQTTSILAPWVQNASFTGCLQGTGQCVSFLNSATFGEQIVRNYASGGVEPNHTDITGILTFTGTPAASVRQAQNTSGAAVTLLANSLAGSTLAGAVTCSAACTGLAATDTQGNTWRQVGIITVTANPTATMAIFVSTTLSTAAADTLTYTTSTGTIAQAMIAEITGASTSQPIGIALFSSVDALGQTVVRLDAQAPNQFTCNVTLSTNTTTQLTGCGAPTTVNNQAVRIYVTDVQVNTTTAGTATTIQLKTGAGTNCATGTANLSAITYTNTAVGLQSFLGFRTPLVAPIGSAVCATQAGTTAGTSVVEVHGFLAP